MAEDLEGLVRQVLAQQATHTAELKAQAGRMGEVAADAREARDGVTKLSAVLGEQNVPEKLGELRGEMQRGLDGMRSDLQNAYSRVRTEIDALKARVDVLERIKEQATGAKSVLSWLSKNAHWFVIIVGAVLVALGLKDKAP